jgi:hypothetical protein
MKKIFLVFTVAFFSSCDKEREIVAPNFTDFVYVNFNLRQNTSLKFSGTDTLFLQKRFPEEPVGNFIAILDKQDRDSLIRKINDLHFEKYKAKYFQEKIEDGNSQVFALNKGKKTKSVFIHGRTCPLEINDFGVWLKRFESKQKFIKTKEYIHFWDLGNLVAPPPPPPVVKKIIFK